jgi:hypothetical protein
MVAVVVWACGQPYDGVNEPEIADADAPDSADAVAVDAAVSGDEHDGGDCWSRPFGAVVNVGEVNSPGKELSFRLTRDELTAFLSRTTAQGDGGDIYVTKRASRNNAFGDLVALASIGALRFNNHPSLSFDGLTLYFSSSGLDVSFHELGTPV